RAHASEGEVFLDRRHRSLAVADGRHYLEGELPVVAVLVEDPLDRTEVDFPRPRLMTPRNVRDVYRRDPIQRIHEVVDQPAAAELLVVAVEEHRHLRMVELAAELERRARVP